MSVGVRNLTVLGEFEPFGLVAEVLDGKPSDDFTDKYDYFLFDPEIARQRDEVEDPDASPSADDHELFIRGNRIIWTIGARAYKRFTLSSPVIMDNMDYRCTSIQEIHFTFTCNHGVLVSSGQYV